MSASHKRKIQVLVSALLNWYAEDARDLPWRREPYKSEPYGVYVSEIMLQQTQVKTVIPYWERWMRELPSIQALAQAPPEKIHKLWEGLGYYTRVRNMQKAAIQIAQQHHGKFPTEFEAVLALPGIGRYTAGAICSIAFNQPTPLLDGNVIRVLARLFAIEENPREKLVNAHMWELATALVQRASVETTLPHRKNCSDLNQSLMELGALICTPRQPKCLLCPVRKQCDAFKTNRVEALPNLDKRGAATERRFIAFVVKNGNRYLVRQRPGNVVNGHLWEFPNVEVPADLEKLPANFSPFVIDPKEQPICRIRHSITRYRILLQAFRATCPRGAAGEKESGTWLMLPELNQLAFSSAHKKILTALGPQ